MSTSIGSSACSELSLALGVSARIVGLKDKRFLSGAQGILKKNLPFVGRWPFDANSSDGPANMKPDDLKVIKPGTRKASSKFTRFFVIFVSQIARGGL